MLDGVALEIGPEAVVVVSREPLTVASTAVVNGGLAPTRAIINLHVHKDHPCADPPGIITRYARARRLPEPWVGLLTSAWTSKAEVGFANAGTTRAMAVVTVGLSNRLAAGVG